MRRRPRAWRGRHSSTCGPWSRCRGATRCTLLCPRGAAAEDRSTMAKKNPLKQFGAELRRAAMGYPETIEDFPWGHSAFKVKGKVFLFLVDTDEELSCSFKLPAS